MAPVLEAGGPASVPAPRKAKQANTQLSSMKRPWVASGTTVVFLFCSVIWCWSGLHTAGLLASLPPQAQRPSGEGSCQNSFAWGPGPTSSLAMSAELAEHMSQMLRRVCVVRQRGHRSLPLPRSERSPPPSVRHCELERRGRGSVGRELTPSGAPMSLWGGAALPCRPASALREVSGVG